MIMIFKHQWVLPFGLSVVLHGVFFLCLLITPWHMHKDSAQRASALHSPSIVQAQVINPDQVAAAVKQLQWKKQQKERAIVQHLKQLQKQSAQAKAYRIAEEKHLLKLKAASQHAHRQHVKKMRALAQLKKKLATTQKKMQAQKKARQQNALEQELAKQVAAEQAALAAKQLAKQSAAADKTINRYKAKIIQAIAQHWVMPKDVDQQLSCQLLLHLAPGGQVLAVRVLRVSGNAVLDRSVRAAVNKASPLPVPTDRHLFDKFRVLRLTVRPEDMN